MPIEIGDVRGVTSNVGADNVVFASPVPFDVGTSISFVIRMSGEAEAQLLRLECRGVVIGGRQSACGGYETSATIDSIHIVPSEL